MKKILSHTFALLLLAAPLAASAESLMNPLGYTSLTEFLSKLLHLIVLILFPIITLFIVYTGFLFVSAGGDTKKLQKAKEYFFYAVIGALIVLGAQALSMAIQATVNDLQRGI